LQVVQLVAVHPLHAELEAADLTVCPWLPLLKKLHEEMSFLTFLLLHDGHSGCSFPKIRHSKFFSHASQ
jgi:hypothetical protein